MSQKDILLTIIVMLLWAICFPLISIGLRMSPPLLFGGLRSLVAGFILLIPAFILGQSLPRTLKIWALLSGIGLSFTTIGFAGMFLAGGLVSPGIATVLANIQPLVAAILAYVFLHERLEGHVKTGLLIGFVGILLISLQGFLTESYSGALGMIFILLGVFGVAIGNVLLKKLAGHIDAFMAIGLQFILGATVLFVLSYFFEPDKQIQWTALFISVLLVLSILGTALATLFWFILLRRTKLTRLNTFSFLTPVFGLIIGAIFFTERLSPIEELGIVFIIGAAYVVGMKHKGKKNVRGLVTGRPFGKTDAQ